ncbi:MAG: hypothetical protein WCB68_06330 [Pyrinomonadaceae bacterium]
MQDTLQTDKEIAARTRRQTLALALVILLGFAGCISLLRWMEAHRPPVDASVEEERLYVNAQTVKRMSLGFNGLVADWYWMRSLQYVGRKMNNFEGRIRLDDLSPLNLKILAPLLDTATTLDPQFLSVYQYGAVVLPAVDEEQAIKLLNKGINANPSAWRLYQHLGYIYWQRKDYQTASAIYGAGAKIQGAPSWMEVMKARMAAEGGSRQTAREIYKEMYDQSDDPQVREVATQRLLQLDSFDERDAIRRALADYNARTGHCPSSWRDAGPLLRAARLRVDIQTSAPLDPANFPYVLTKGGCDVELDPNTTIPRK